MVFIQKGNLKTQLDFELAYYKAAVQHFNNTDFPRKKVKTDRYLLYMVKKKIYKQIKIEFSKPYVCKEFSLIFNLQWEINSSLNSLKVLYFQMLYFKSTSRFQ